MCTKKLHINAPPPSCRCLIRIVQVCRTPRSSSPAMDISSISAHGCSNRFARGTPQNASKRQLLCSKARASPLPPNNATGPTPRDCRCSVTPHHPLNASLGRRTFLSNYIFDCTSVELLKMERMRKVAGPSSFHHGRLRRSKSRLPWSKQRIWITKFTYVVYLISSYDI